MKKILMVLLAALLLAGCSDISGGVPEPPSGSETTTTQRLSAVEDQPENTTTSDPDQTDVPPVQDDIPESFPPPYPAGSVDDPEMLELLKDVIQSAETAQSVLNGKYTLIPLGEGAQGDYRVISSDYANDLSELTRRMYECNTYTFWEEQYGRAIEDTLSGLVKETEQGIALYCGESEEPYLIDISTAVITSLRENGGKVVALGTLGDSYIWRTYDMYHGSRGWLVDTYSDEEVTGEIALFSRLLIDSRPTLDAIFGSVTPVTDQNGNWSTQLVTIENDIYGHGFYNGLEIEPFMTVEEMRQYLRNTFTSEIAESYISLYVNRTYVESGGKLYIISGSILPQMGEFSLDNYENRSISSYDITSLVDWTDGNVTYTLPITVTYEGGLWRLDTRLPMMKDRIIN